MSLRELEIQDRFYLSINFLPYAILLILYLTQFFICSFGAVPLSMRFKMTSDVIRVCLICRNKFTLNTLTSFVMLNLRDASSSFSRKEQLYGKQV